MSSQLPVDTPIDHLALTPDIMATFHPVIASWFCRRFGTPTGVQERGWPLLRADEPTLIAAPTGSGKTLAAFLVAIDHLLRAALDKTLDDAVQVVYVSPLKALSHDIKKNLDEPLAEIMAEAVNMGYGKPKIRVAVRTGDTTATERARILREPPHILVTTPESLYLMLTSVKARLIMAATKTVIVDEIHALARDKRGSHLALTLERLDHLIGSKAVRIGLSATQKPLERIAAFLVGTRDAPCQILDCGGPRRFDLEVVLPPTALTAVCSHDTWAEIDDQLCELIQAHTSTLIFVNTRKLAERLSFQLQERLGEEAVQCHHGSLAREKRLDVEDRLKRGTLKAIVATASLELGIDIGFVDLVCQIGSPRSLATFIQRIGRSGHSRHGTPKGRLFALTRDELLECYALVRAARQGHLDEVEIPQAPIDILSQQIIAMVAVEPWGEDALLECIRRAYPFQDLATDMFDTVLTTLSEGLSPSTRRGAYLFRDNVNRTLKPRRSARLAAITSGGAIPEQNSFRVVTSDSGIFVGTLDEEFAVESVRGDVFQLGNTSWRIERVQEGKVIVHDAGGAPSSIPFWQGEAPGRTYELSQQVSRLREDLAELLGTDVGDDTVNHPAARAFLTEECAATSHGIDQALRYVASQIAATGVLPTQKRIVLERFFDETGGMQLVLHAPFGTRINKAWGLAFRKRFCRGFDFELQAAANDDGIILSIGPNQSFALDALFGLLAPEDGTEVLVQALLAIPMFNIRWRWNATRSLAILRQKAGKKVPPHLQRFQADDLLTAVFPQQTQCFEHRTGDLEVPDHPLVKQTVHDCLTEAMDLKRWRDVCQAIRRKEIEVVHLDTREPSPFSHELLNANPYAFLDDAPLEERRTRAVSTRRWFNPEDVRDLCGLSPDAIATVRRDAWPLVRDADELYEALRQLVIVSDLEMNEWTAHKDALFDQGRLARVEGPECVLWAAVESAPALAALYPDLTIVGAENLPERLAQAVEPEEALALLTRGQLECRGPVTASFLAQHLRLPLHRFQSSLAALESRGLILSGNFTQGPGEHVEKEWCERRLLGRIHRLTIDGLREEIRPVAPEVFWRFLCRNQGVHPESRRERAVGVQAVLEQLSGFETAAGTWENELLTARVKGYEPGLLDQLAATGKLAWGRLSSGTSRATVQAPLFTRTAAMSLFPRLDQPYLLQDRADGESVSVSREAEKVLGALQGRGALFFEELCAEAKVLASQAEDALGELVFAGLVTNDSFAAIRALTRPEKRVRERAKRGRYRLETGFAEGGRWSLFPGASRAVTEDERAEFWARKLLSRYGVLSRDLLVREALAPSWYSLTQVLRRLEMRGEIRGGRFVASLSGEQFALPEVIATLREEAKKKASGEWLVLSACDPLNLSALLGSEKVPAMRTHRFALVDGKIACMREGSTFKWLVPVSVEKRALLERALTLSGLYRDRDPFLREERVPVTGVPKKVDFAKLMASWQTQRGS